MLNERTKTECDIALFFDDIDQKIKEIEEEQMFPWKETDINAGIKGGGNSDITFNRVASKDILVLRNLKQIRDVVGEEYQKLSYNNQDIIRSIYLNATKAKNGRRSDKRVAVDFNIKSSYVKNLRKYFIRQVGRRLGYHI